MIKGASFDSLKKSYACKKCYAKGIGYSAREQFVCSNVVIKFASFFFFFLSQGQIGFEGS